MDKIKKALIRREAIAIFLIIILLVVYGMFFKPNPWLRIGSNNLEASGAESALNIDAPSQIDGVGKSFIVKIKLDTMGNSVNAIQSYLTFDPQVLQITSTNTQQSFCKFYPENNYDNSKGLVKLSCGSPYPGFKGENVLEEIVFMPKAIQTTKIELTGDSMVLANDGKGTNLLKNIPSSEIKINAGL